MLCANKVVCFCSKSVLYVSQTRYTISDCLFFSRFFSLFINSIYHCWQIHVTEAAIKNTHKAVKNKASSVSTSKKNSRPTSKGLEEAGKQLHSLSDTVQKKIEHRGIPNNYEIRVLAAKFSCINLNSDKCSFTSCSCDWFKRKEELIMI